MIENVLEVKDLKVEFDTYGGVVQAVRGVHFQVQKGKTLAIVGESGCGKSVSIQSILGLIPTPPGRITSGSAKLNGQELMGLPLKELNKVRGNNVGVIFQDPMSSLNPTMTIGEQISETLRYHKDVSRKEGRRRAIELLGKVQISEAASRVDSYPFQFSGGMRQRVMIAMALACEPELLIADEPTTALDVTIQSQILNLLKELQNQSHMALILITHDLGVVARMADTVSVMYAGQVVEHGTVDDIFYRSTHPYTSGLRAALPTRERNRQKLIPIDGAPPDLFSPPKGCGYFARCPSAMKICENRNPPEFVNSTSHYGRCWLAQKNSMTPMPTEGVL
ncbi:MAG: ABC transporter ATP-binding protein [Bdellovibrionaceae bacterium]|nr:ABC transporter ATP-binding protein [Pseudobdellovibrionaceae bacterium]